MEKNVQRTDKKLKIAIIHPDLGIGLCVFRPTRTFPFFRRKTIKMLSCSIQS